MPWATEEDGSIKVVDGAPVAIIGDKETPFQIDKYLDTSKALRTEAAQNREALEAAEAKLEGAVSLEDHKKAVADLEKLQKKVKAAAKNGDAQPDPEMAERLEELTAKLGTLEQAAADGQAEIARRDGEIFELRVKSRFQADPHFVAAGAEQPLSWLTPNAAFNNYGQHFKVEDGAVVAYAADGKTVLRTPEGARANFTEAIAQIIAADPEGKTLMRSSGADGGNGGGSDRNGGNPTTMTRQSFDALPSNQRAEFAKRVGEGKAKFA